MAAWRTPGFHVTVEPHSCGRGNHSLLGKTCKGTTGAATVVAAAQQHGAKGSQPQEGVARAHGELERARWFEGPE